MATIGPSSDSHQAVRDLIEAGVSVFRFNFSHGSLEDHARRLAVVREVSAEMERPIAALGDLQGPKIRVGKVPDPGIMLERGQDVVFRKGETGEDMYIIVQGKIAIRDGETNIATLGVREFFGELSVIDRDTRSADAVAIEAAELLRLRAADLGELMARRPQIQEQILLVLVRRLRIQNARLSA